MEQAREINPSVLFFSCSTENEEIRDIFEVRKKGIVIDRERRGREGESVSKIMREKERERAKEREREREREGGRKRNIYF